MPDFEDYMRMLGTAPQGALNAPPSASPSERRMAIDVQMTPDEMEADRQHNLTPASLAELDTAIRNAKDPRARSVLEAERDRIMSEDAGGEFVRTNAPAPQATPMQKRDSKVVAAIGKRGTPEPSPEVDLLDFDAIMGKDAEAPAKKSGGVMGRARDFAIDLAAKGPVSLGESVVGIADILTFGAAGHALASAGYDPKRTREILSDLYTDERKQANQNVENAKGFVDTSLALIQNPSALVGIVLESLPGTVGIGGVARSVAEAAFVQGAKSALAAGPALPAAVAKAGEEAVKAAMPKIMAVAAGAEGAQAAGSIAEQARQANREWSQYVLPALAGGAATAGIGLLSAHIGNSAVGRKLGLADVETGIATSGLASNAGAPGVVRRIVGGGAKEGALEELPQSAVEQGAQNVAMGKPIGEGVGEAAAQGLLAGAVTGGAFNALAGGPRPDAAAGAPAPQIDAQTPPPAQPEPPPTVSQTQLRELAQARVEELEQLVRRGPRGEVFAGRDENGKAVFEQDAASPPDPADRRELTYLRGALTRGDDAAIASVLGVEIAPTAVDAAQQTGSQVNVSTGQPAPTPTPAAAGVEQPGAAAAVGANPAVAAQAGSGEAVAGPGASPIPGTSVISAAQLPDRDTEVKVRLGDAEHAGTRISKSGFTNLQRISQQLFGKNLVLIQHDNPTAETWFDGVVVNGDANNIYLSADTLSAHAGVIFGHELGHHLRDQNPEAWNTFANAVMSMSHPDAISKMRAQYTGSASLTDDAVREEMVNDILGNRFGEKQFWEQLWNKVGDQHGESGIQRVFSAVKNWFANLLTRARVRGFSTDSYITDLNKARDAAVDAMASYIAQVRKQREDAKLPTTDQAFASIERDAEIAKLLHEKLARDAKAKAEQDARDRDYIAARNQKADQDTANTEARTKNDRPVGAPTALAAAMEKAKAKQEEKAKAPTTIKPKAPPRNEPEKMGDVLRRRRAEEVAAQKKPEPELRDLIRANMAGRASALRRVDPFEMSTRLPTAKKATEDPIANLLSPDIDVLMQDRALLERNLNALESMHGFPHKAGLPLDTRLKNAVEFMAGNLLFLYDTMTPKFVESNRKWYDGANKIANEFAKKYGVTPAQSSAVLAVFSPKTDWFQNVEFARRTFEIYRNAPSGQKFDKAMSNAALAIDGKELDKMKSKVAQVEGKTLAQVKRADLKAIWIKAYDTAHRADRGFQNISPEGEFLGYKLTTKGTPQKTSFGFLSGIAKAVSIIEDGSMENISKKLGAEHKVRSFYNNILAPKSENNHVTVDTHALNAALMRPVLGSSATEVSQLFGGKGTGSSSVSGLRGTYPIYKEAYRIAAERRNISPREMQSVTWSAVREIATDVEKRNKAFVSGVEDIWSKYANRKLSVGQARQSVVQLAERARAERDAARSAKRPAAGGDDSGRRSADARDVSGAQRNEGAAGRRGRGDASGALPQGVKRSVIRIALLNNSSRHLSSEHWVVPESLAAQERLNAEMDRMYSDAADQKDLFDEAIKTIAEAAGVDYKIAPLKGRGRAGEKIIADYKGDPSKIKDLLRASIVVDSPAQAQAALAVLRDTLPPAKVAGQFKDTLSSAKPNPNSPGYADIKYIADINGVNAEVIILPRQMLAPKEIAHPLYAKQGEIARAMALEGRNEFTPEEDQQMSALNADMRSLFQPALKEFTAASNSAREISVPFRLRLNTLKGRLSGSKAAQKPSPAPDILAATGTPSTSKNAVPSGNDSGSMEGSIVGEEKIPDNLAGWLKRSSLRNGETLEQFAADIRTKARASLEGRLADMQAIADGKLTEYQSKLPVRQRMSVAEAKAEVAEIKAALTAVDAKYSPEALRSMYEGMKAIGRASPFRAVQSEGFWRTVERQIGTMERAQSSNERALASATAVPVMITPPAWRSIKALRRSEYVTTTAGNIYLKGTDQHHQSFHGQAIPVDVLRNLPEMMSDPVAIYHKSAFDRANPKSVRMVNDEVYLVVLPHQLKDGSFVTVAVAADVAHGKAKVNFIKSVHPRTKQQLNTYARHLVYYNDAYARNKAAPTSPGPNPASESSRQSRVLEQGWLNVPAQAGAVKIPSRSSLEQKQSETVNEQSQESQAQGVRLSAQRVSDGAGVAERAGPNRAAGNTAENAIATGDEAVAVNEKYPPSRKRLGKCHVLAFQKVTFEGDDRYHHIIGVTQGVGFGRLPMMIWHSWAYDPETGHVWEPISNRWYTKEAAHQAFGFEPVVALTARETRKAAFKSGLYPDQTVVQPRGWMDNFMFPGDWDADWSTVGGEPVSVRASRARVGVNVEVAPNPDNRVLTARFNALSFERRFAATREVAGPAIAGVMKDFGINGYQIEYTVGGYEGHSNPSVILRMPADFKYESIAPIGLSLGAILDQQSIVTYDETQTDGDGLATFVRLVPSRPLSMEEQAALGEAIFSKFPQAAGFTGQSGALAFGNFTDASDDVFQDGITRALRGMGELGYDVTADRRRFKSALEFIKGDEGASYESNVGGTESERAPVRGQGRFDSHQKLARETLQRFLRSSLRERSGADRGSRENVRQGFDGSRPDATGGVEGYAHALAGVPAHHWQRVQPRAVSLVGVHYGERGLTALDPTKFGTGARSEEFRSIPSDSVIRDRVYFYAQKDANRLPDSERAVTAGYVYRTQLDNLYDTRSDPDGLIKQAQRERMGIAALDEMIHAAGYDGYVNWRHHGDGSIVVFGSKNPIPVQPLGTRYEAKEKVARASALRVTETPEFQQWFGNSKVVDAEGKPLVVYHGTTKDFASFDPSASQRATGVQFTSSPDSASFYAGGEGGRVLPVYVNLSRPYEVDLTERGEEQDGLKSEDELSGGDFYPTRPVDWFDEMGRDEIAQAMASGKYDGYIVRGDGGELLVGALRSEQIKSAIGNSGKFDSRNPNILKSGLRVGIADAIANANLPSGFVGSVRDNLSDIVRPTEQGHFNWWHRTVGTQLHKARINPYFGKVFNLGQKFLDDVAMFAMRAQDKAPDILPNLGKLSMKAMLGGMSKQDNELVGRALSEGTLVNGADPHTGKVWSDAELRSMFKMDARQIGLYRQARAAIDQSLDDAAKGQMSQIARIAGVSQDVIESLVEKPMAMNDVRDALLKELAALPPSNATRDAIKNVRNVAGETGTLKGAGYAPLMRFGKYTVSVKDAKGDLAWFSMHESKAEASRTKNEVMTKYPPTQGYKAETGELNPEAYKLYQGISPSTIEAFFNTVPLSNPQEEEARRKYMQLAVSNRSAMARMIKRHGYAGYTVDATRTLAHFIASNSRQSSKAINMPQMLKAAQEATEKGGGDIGSEATKLLGYLQNPAEGAQAIRGFLFFNFLGGSLAAGLVNLTQPVMMTLPYLSRFGAARASAAMTSSLGDTMRWMRSKKIGDPQLSSALKKAQENGIIEPQEIFQLMSAAESGTSSLLQHKFMRVWGYNFAITEVLNRTLTFSAAYKMGVRLSPQQLSEAGAKDAYEFAVRAVEDTQGLYNKGNRPNLARETGALGALGTVAFTFKQYAIAYVEFLKRLYGDGLLPRKEFLLAVAILMLASGTDGLPGSDDMDDVIDTIGNWLGYPTNSKRWKRDLLTDALGADAADFVQRGVSHYLPLDLQARLGLGNIVPGTALFNPTKPEKAREALDVLGPLGGVAQSAADAAGAAFRGDARGVGMAVLPKALRDAYAGFEMASTGEFRDAKGRVVRKTTPEEGLIKAVGFNPESFAEESRAEKILKGDVEIVKAKKAEFNDRLARALAMHDGEARAKTMAEIAEWNRRVPAEYRIIINPRAVSQRARQMNLTREERFVKSAPREMRQAIRTDLREMQD